MELAEAHICLVKVTRFCLFFAEESSLVTSICSFVYDKSSVRISLFCRFYVDQNVGALL